MGGRLTHNEFMNKVKERYPNDILIALDSYKNRRTVVRMKHEKCGKIIERDGGNWMYTAITPCPSCYDNSYKPVEVIMKDIWHENPNIQLVSEAHKRNKRGLNLYCQSCEFSFYKSVYNINRSLARGGKVCVKCVGLHRFSSEEFNEALEESTGGEYSLSGIYKNSHTSIEVFHNKCGRTTKKYPSLAIKGKVCNHCYPKNSTFPERVISDFLREKGIPFKSEYTYPNLLGVGGRNLRFDFCLFIGNKEILIEYDGAYHFEAESNHFHSNDYGIEHDKRKDDYCSQKGLTLYRIPYTVESQQKIEEKILAIIQENLPKSEEAK